MAWSHKLGKAFGFTYWDGVGEINCDLATRPAVVQEISALALAG